MNREQGPNDEAPAADNAAAGVNLDDLNDLGDEVPVETGANASEALTEAVRRALQEDTMTNWLNVQVEVVDSVVRLHGRVRYLEDAEAAEAVASRVAGVRYIQDEIEVETMPGEG